MPSVSRRPHPHTHPIGGCPPPPQPHAHLVSLHDDSYAWSFMFDKHTTAQTFTMLFYYLGTMVTFFTVFVLSFPSISSIPTVVPEILNYVFLLFPNYALSKAFMNVNIKASCFEFGGPSALRVPCAVCVRVRGCCVHACVGEGGCLLRCQ